ncbi:hypothetical protein UFOVP143_50 [uncultured Caudovirales phage]|uniref:Uncharacterized protein n=1 Tax=uncultured Caudovirales phage TaxID=2100421 RepID=A0A6J7VM12_9CAUD|nr:hypothetical protein UFOVP143_50 [uncultured Caudovirales phage]
MCFPKAPRVPKPVPPPSPPSKMAADVEAENTRRLLAQRQSAAASVKTGQLGATDYGKNTQTPGLSGAQTSSTLGV